MGEAWYVLQCAARHDQQVEQLVRLHGVESFAPRIAKTRACSGNKALFPGYVFVHLDPRGTPWQTVRSLPGVHSLVQIGGGPCPVADEIVAGIRYLAATYLPGPGHLQVGDPVRIHSGAFAAAQGIFTESLRGDVRAAIMTAMMHREVRVELDADTIERSGRVVAA